MYEINDGARIVLFGESDGNKVVFPLLTVLRESCMSLRCQSYPCILSGHFIAYC